MIQAGPEPHSRSATALILSMQAVQLSASPPPTTLEGLCLAGESVCFAIRNPERDYFICELSKARRRSRISTDSIEAAVPRQVRYSPGSRKATEFPGAKKARKCGCVATPFANDAPSACSVESTAVASADNIGLELRAQSAIRCRSQINQSVFRYNCPIPHIRCDCYVFFARYLHT